MQYVKEKQVLREEMGRGLNEAAAEIGRTRHVHEGHGAEEAG